MRLANTMKPSANLLKIRLFSVTMGLLISASLSQAALIDNGIFTTDEATGLDWLDLTYTDGDSYNTTLAAISTGELVGWRFATTEEFYGLIDAAVGSSYTPVGSNGQDPAIYSEMVTLIDLFEYTHDSFYEIHALGYVDSSELTDAYRIQFSYTYNGKGVVNPQGQALIGIKILQVPPRDHFSSVQPPSPTQVPQQLFWELGLWL